MKEQDFSKAEVGQMVFNLSYGWSKIEFKDAGRIWLSSEDWRVSIDRTFSGRANENSPFPDTFWDKPEIVIPDPPKITRTVTVHSTKYGNVYYKLSSFEDQNIDEDRYLGCIRADSPEGASSRSTGEDIVGVATIKITEVITWEEPAGA